MTIRQRDTWVLDCYVDEAGWDGQHSHLYFSTYRDAVAVGARIETLVEDFHDDRSFDWMVFKAAVLPSFHNDPTGLQKLADDTLADWGIEPNEEEEATDA